MALLISQLDSSVTSTGTLIGTPTGAPRMPARSLPKELSSVIQGWRIQTEELALEVSAAIMKFYGDADSSGARLKNDSTPVTEADLAADRLLQSALPRIAPYPVVSEESHEAGARVVAPSYWVADPLDGTQNFINGDGEFSVAIGLIVAGVPVLGVVAVPAKDVVYSAHLGGGAFKLDGGLRTSISADARRGPPESAVRILASKLPSAEAITETRASCSASGIPYERIGRVGSAYKQGLLAEGACDLVLCFDRMWEWDIAAGDCLLHEAGCVVRDKGSLQPFKYNQTSDRKFTGYFAAHRDLCLRWA